MNIPLKILILCGSMRAPSYTHSLCVSIQQELDRLGCDTSLWNLQNQILPFADPRFHHDPFHEDNDRMAKEFINTIMETDAVILATPIYHNSYSGIIKNALDHLTIPLLSNKTIGLVSHGGNRSPQAVDQLRIVARSLHAHTIPNQVCTAASDFSTDNTNYIISSEPIRNRIEKFSQELVFVSRMFKILRDT